MRVGCPSKCIYFYRYEVIEIRLARARPRWQAGRDLTNPSGRQTFNRPGGGPTFGDMVEVRGLSTLARFARAVDRPEASIDLGEAALTIAMDVYRDLDVEAYLRRLDAFAEPLRDRG